MLKPQKVHEAADQSDEKLWSKSAGMIRTCEWPAPTSNARNARVFSSLINDANVAKDAENLEMGI